MTEKQPYTHDTDSKVAKVCIFGGLVFYFVVLGIVLHLNGWCV